MDENHGVWLVNVFIQVLRQLRMKRSSYSSFIRSGPASTDSPLDSPLFAPPTAYNAPQQVPYDLLSSQYSRFLVKLVKRCYVK